MDRFLTLRIIVLLVFGSLIVVSSRMEDVAIPNHSSYLDALGYLDVG